MRRAPVSTAGCGVPAKARCCYTTAGSSLLRSVPAKQQPHGPLTCTGAPTGAHSMLLSAPPLPSALPPPPPADAAAACAASAAASHCCQVVMRLLIAATLSSSRSRRYRWRDGSCTPFGTACTMPACSPTAGQVRQVGWAHSQRRRQREKMPPPERPQKSSHVCVCMCSCVSDDGMHMHTDGCRRSSQARVPAGMHGCAGPLLTSWPCAAGMLGLRMDTT